MKTIVYSYLFYLLASTLDILSSLGQLEENPAMQGAGGVFSLRLGLEIKACFFVFYLLVSLWLYICLRGWNKTFASLFAAMIPAYATFSLFCVALDNVLGRFQ